MSLREKNLKYFEENLPQIYKALSNFEPRWQIQTDDGGKICVTVEDGTKPFGEDYQSTLDLQFKTFNSGPSRVLFATPAINAPSDYEEPKDVGDFATMKYDDRAADDHFAVYVKDLAEKRQDNKHKILVKPAMTKTPYYLVIWGIGLGSHISKIIDEYKPSYLVIVDDGVEGLYASLDYTDWPDLFVKIKDKNIKLKLSIDKTKHTIVAKLHGLISSESLLGMDGLLNFTHYLSPVLKVAFADFLSEKTGNLANFIGFTVDEYNMMKNSFRNLRTGSKRMLTGYTQKIGKPVMIVGSGPSLEKNLDYLKENRDRFILISSGSSLKVLLKNGIESDFHANLERAKSIYERHVELVNDEKFDLKNIVAILTTTIWPGIDAFFKDAIYFLRPALSPLAVYCEDTNQVLMGEGPQVTNTAFSFSQRIGASEIILLGVDLGTSDPVTNRAKDAWKGIRPRNLTIPVRGNAGKTVLTDMALLQQKATLEALIKKQPQIPVKNLGDGVKIEGAIRVPIDEISNYPIIVDRKTIVNQVLQATPVYTKERFYSNWEAANIRGSVASMVGQIVSVLENTPGWTHAMVKKIEDINQYSNKPVRAQFAPRLLRGSFLRSFMHAHSYIIRATPECSETVIKDVKDSLINLLRKLEHEAYSLADELEHEDGSFQ